MKKKLVTLKEAVEILNDAFQNDPNKTGRSVISIGGLYNALYKGKLTKYGSRHFRQVDVDELLAVYGPQKSA